MPGGSPAQRSRFSCECAMLSDMQNPETHAPVPTKEELDEVRKGAQFCARIHEHFDLESIAPVGPFPYYTNCKRCGRSLTIGYKDGKLTFGGTFIGAMCERKRGRARR